MQSNIPGSTAEPLGSAYAAQFGTAFAAAPLGSVLGSAAAAAAGKQVEGTGNLYFAGKCIISQHLSDGLYGQFF